MSEKKTIRIECEGSTTADYKSLNHFQGALKSLPEENYQKFKRLILDLGYSFPISVWIDPQKKRQIINGHQTLTTITRLVEQEGYTVGPLPICLVKAKTLKEAKKKVLAAASQMGKVDPDGLHQFLLENEFDLELLQTDFEFPEIDPLHFLATYRSEAEPELTKELDKGSSGAEQPSSLHTRQIQFFLTEEEFQKFGENIKKLQAAYGTQNVTETVFEAVRRAASDA